MNMFQYNTMEKNSRKSNRSASHLSMLYVFVKSNHTVFPEHDNIE